jgi:hypothetical protein
MAQGQWVDIPGRGRRWRQPSGELMEQKPGLGFVQAQLSPVTNFLGSLFQAPGAFNVGRLQARPPMPGLPTDYKRTELAAGAAAERYRPGAGFPGQQAAAERAYQSEASRVAQLTAQDPELQRYEAARLKAVAPGATAEQVQSAEDIGMQIWRQKYGTTPMGQTGGAVGSLNPLMRETFGYQTGMAPDQLTAMQKTAAPIPVAPGAMPYQMGDLGTRATLETGYDPAAYGLTPDKIEEMKKKLLQQASK